MRKTLAAIAIAIAVAGLVIAFGRDSDPLRPGGGGPSIAGPLPELQPSGKLPTDALVTGPGPKISSATTTLDDVVDLATRSSGTASAEKFAAHFVQLLTDTRRPLDVDSLVEDLAADQLPVDDREFLRSNLANEYAQKIGRRWVVTEDSWIRTNIASDGTVQVEIAFREATDVFPDYIRWPVIRVDVIDEGGRWKVSDLGARQIDPLSRPELDDSALYLHLDGSGWREIAPVSK